MTLTAERPLDDPRRRPPRQRRRRPSRPAPAVETPVKQTRDRQLVSGELDQDLADSDPVLDRGGVRASSCKVFVTFWGLLPFVKDRSPHHRRQLDAEDAVRDAAARASTI